MRWGPSRRKVARAGLAGRRRTMPTRRASGRLSTSVLAASRSSQRWPLPRWRAARPLRVSPAATVTVPARGGGGRPLRRGAGQGFGRGRRCGGGRRLEEGAVERGQDDAVARTQGAAEADHAGVGLRDAGGEGGVAVVLAGDRSERVARGDEVVAVRAEVGAGRRGGVGGRGDEERAVFRRGGDREVRYGRVRRYGRRRRSNWASPRVRT